MSDLLRVLVFLSIIAINPLSYNAYFIWVVPKLYILFFTCIFLLVFCIEKEYKFYSKTWLEWTLFIAWGAACTLHSSVPLVSFLGVGFWGDGLLYWMLCAGVYMLLETCIYHNPIEFRNLDIPVFIGIVFSLLPLDLFARPGHHAYVIGLGVIILGIEGVYTGIGTIALLMLGSRAPILGLIAAFFPKLWKRFRVLMIVGITAIVLMSSQRKIINGEAFIQNRVIRNVTSDRVNLVYSVTMPDINPVFGKGFNGLMIRRLEEPEERSWIHTAKSHNIFSDMYISLGIPGLLFYLLLLIQILKPLPREFVIYHCIFLFFWYDSAQYTHLILFLSVNYRLTLLIN